MKKKVHVLKSIPRFPSTSLRSGEDIKITFFKTQSDFRKWLIKNHSKASELYTGFYKTNSGKPSITWPQSVDEALCFGWIDGIRKRIDEESYYIRFAPRKTRSIWSAINIKRFGELKKLGLITPSGIKAFEERDIKRSGKYSYENRIKELDDYYKKKLKSNKKAWDFFQSQPPWYQRTASFWVMIAVKKETREKRLNIFIFDSEKHKRIIAITLKKS